MKYQEQPEFWADWEHLNHEHRRLFLRAVRAMNEAYARRGASPLPRWPARLRIRPMAGHPGVWEMTWSFAGPDGRATFELVEVDGGPAIRWRRIGGHGIYAAP